MGIAGAVEKCGFEEVQKGERNLLCLKMMLLREGSIHLDFGLHY
jgi:hypothetical protein